MEEKKIILFNKKEDCCGCGACMNICSNQAITMEEDAYGFLYPVINEAKCIRCLACKKVCAFQNITETNEPKQVYVASSRCDGQIMKSASGGVFAAFAIQILENGGVVFGASMDYSDGVLNPLHIGITKKKDLIKLQGSKYVQSAIGATYGEAEKYLMAGRTVLFSGTPCQIAGLRELLKKDHENLITVDIICHGVPSAKFFQDYLKALEEKLHGEIIDFKFRDKTRGWGLTGKALYKKADGKVREKLIPSELSSYYKLFLDSETYRENCYVCKYASSHRPGDITAGDYWGIQHEHPEVMERNGGIFSDKKGISCLIVNTDKGERYLEQFKYGLLNLVPSTFEKAARENAQLNRPSRRSNSRENLLELYQAQGFSAVEKFFEKKAGVKIWYHKVKNMMPKGLRNVLKKIMA